MTEITLHDTSPESVKETRAAIDKIPGGKGSLVEREGRFFIDAPAHVSRIAGELGFIVTAEERLK